MQFLKYILIILCIHAHMFALCASRPLVTKHIEVSYTDIEHLLSPEINKEVALMEKEQPSPALLFTGGTEDDFLLLYSCIAEKTGFCTVRCSAHELHEIGELLKKSKFNTEPMLIMLEHLDSLDSQTATELLSILKRHKVHPSCIIGWANDASELSEDFQRYFNFPLELSKPTEAQRKTFFEKILERALPNYSEIDTAILAKKTADYSVSQLIELAQNSILNAHKDTILKYSLQKHFEIVLNKIQEIREKAHRKILASASLSYAQPSTTFEELSFFIPRNFCDIKRTIRRTGYYPGILLYGPPGTGKSSLAEALAADIGWKYVRCNGASFASSYQDGVVLRLKRAIDALQATGEPTVLCLDECSAIFNKTIHAANNSHESTITYLRQLIEDCNENKLKTPILIIATTNDIHSIDAAIANRFSANTFEIDVPPTEVKKQIIGNLLKKITKDPEAHTKRAELINNICMYSEGLSTRFIAQSLKAAKNLALNDHWTTIPDSYFYTAFKATLLELVAKGFDNKNSRFFSASMGDAIKNECTTSVIENFHKNVTLKTLAIMSLSIPGVTTCAKMIKPLNRLIWYRNAREIGKLELAALEKNIRLIKKSKG